MVDALAVRTSPFEVCTIARLRIICNSQHFWATLKIRTHFALRSVYRVGVGCVCRPVHNPLCECVPRWVSGACVAPVHMLEVGVGGVCRPVHRGVGCVGGLCLARLGKTELLQARGVGPPDLEPTRGR